MDNFTIVMCTIFFAAMAITVLVATRISDDLVKKLSILLDDSVITPKYWNKSSITGTYHGYTTEFEWAAPRMGISVNIRNAAQINIKIHDLNIPALGKGSQSDLVIQQSDTTNIAKEFSDLSSVQEIKFANNILQVKLSWLNMPSNAQMVEEASIALDAMLKISQWSS